MASQTSEIAGRALHTPELMLDELDPLSEVTTVLLSAPPPPRVQQAKPAAAVGSCSTAPIDQPVGQPAEPGKRVHNSNSPSCSQAIATAPAQSRRFTQTPRSGPSHGRATAKTANLQVHG